MCEMLIFYQPCRRLHSSSITTQIYFYLLFEQVLDSDVGPSSSSASTVTPPNGRNGRMLTPTSDDGEYVEYSFDNISDMPYTEEDEDRMLMQAILESLKDLDKSNTKNTQSAVSDVASKENSVAPDVVALETDASSISVRGADAPGKDVAACNSVAKASSLQSADRCTVNDAVSANVSGASESNGSTQVIEGKYGSAESQKLTQNPNGEDGTRATLVVQKSRTGSLIDGLTQKWGSFFKNND
ncbi:unnamed protein product [Triticum turgidum subsp. durum]|uniref:Uncharacterized protein n=1 Tax=Triticum turgidum subsp. durum TaxID=4567 RepID=A0A9R0T2I7_TRITD|nr:unnamed protein product [Triticum turgidum subsp. durum]